MTNELNNYQFRVKLSHFSHCICIKYNFKYIFRKPYRRHAMQASECEKAKIRKNNTNIIEAFFASPHILCPKVTVSPVNSQPMLSFSTNIDVFEGGQAYMSSQSAQICWPSPEIVLCIMPNELLLS